jgi:DNA primase
VIFPWLNVSGKVVAFGGRLLDSRTKGVQQKYVNSPDSEIYHKERELYGLYQAKKAIAKEDRVFMVEGYTDVIAMHQCGLENVVANSGTALSVHQIKLLRRFTQNITLLYDGDEAGIHAAMRGTDMLLAEGMNIKVLLLPDGDDPDSFARKHTAEQLKAYIEENQTDFISFKTRLTVENVTDPVKRSEAIGGIVKSISVIPDQILRSTYLSELSRRMGIKEQTLLNSMNGMIRKDIEEKEKERERETQKNPEPTTEFIGLHSVDEQTREVERLLIQAVVRHGDEIIYDHVETDDGGEISLNVAQYIDYDLSQDGLHFHDERYNQILAEAVAHSEDGGFKAEAYFTQHPDVAISQLAHELAVERHQLGRNFQPKVRDGALRQNVLHLVLDLRLDIIDKHLKEIHTQLRQVGNDMDRVKELLEELKMTQELRNALAKKLGNDLII